MDRDPLLTWEDAGDIVNLALAIFIITIVATRLVPWLVLS